MTEGGRCHCGPEELQAPHAAGFISTSCKPPFRLHLDIQATTCRLHLDVKRCVFGNDGEPDSDAHYVRCAALRAAFSQAGVADLQRPGEVAGLVPPDPLRAAIISRTYVLWRRMLDVDGARLELLVSALAENLALTRPSDGAAAAMVD